MVGQGRFSRCLLRCEMVSFNRMYQVAFEVKMDTAEGVYCHRRQQRKLENGD